MAYITYYIGRKKDIFELNRYMLLNLTMPNFLNGIIHLQFLALSIINFRDIKMKTCVGQPIV